MKVKCFGIFRDIVSKGHIDINDCSDIHRVSDLKEWITTHYPTAKKIRGFMIAVNLEYADDTQIIGAVDELAIIPPVSGG